jgi:hypothetical protein
MQIPRLCKSFQPRRDIDGISEQIVALNNYVADMDSDTKPHLLTGRAISILLRYSALHGDSTLHRIHGTTAATAMSAAMVVGE